MAKKLEVLVDVPEELDLEWLRGRGPQPDEQLQPEEQPSSSPAAGLDTLAAAAAGHSHSHTRLAHVKHRIVTAQQALCMRSALKRQLSSAYFNCQLKTMCSCGGIMLWLHEQASFISCSDKIC